MYGKCEGCGEVTEINIDGLCEHCQEEADDASGVNDPRLWGEYDDYC